VPFSNLNMTGRPSRQAKLARSKSKDDIQAESLPIIFIFTIAVAVPKVTANQVEICNKQQYLTIRPYMKRQNLETTVI